ncbi:hypothetical protein [Pseudomonas syringae group genomosp. 3]|uniref:hypothetical protein n=1 Tax=Pseudomonas syringae group genomosp. 3 TaxID=251701 RepID=UPI0011C3EA3F|nr:hypothetical protein [Pseudomonas syringae group genomosp. 3]
MQRPEVSGNFVYRREYMRVWGVVELNVNLRSLDKSSAKKIPANAGIFSAGVTTSVVMRLTDKRQ